MCGAHTLVREILNHLTRLVPQVRVRSLDANLGITLHNYAALNLSARSACPFSCAI